MTQQKSMKALSGGLVGALAIAGGTSAYADVISVGVPADLTNTPGSVTTTTVNWDVNGDGTSDFVFSNRYPNSATQVVWQLNMNNLGTNGVVGYVGPFISYANALSNGDLIGPASVFQTVYQVCLGSNYGGTFYGGFAADVAPGTPAFAGFRFQAADGVHYGWIQLSVNAGVIDFISAAYQSTPGATLNAGVIPEPSTMAMLAVGAAGALATVIKRRRRRA